MFPVKKRWLLLTSIIRTHLVVNNRVKMIILFSILVFNVALLTSQNQFFDCIFCETAHFFVIFDQKCTLTTSDTMLAYPLISAVIAEKYFTLTTLSHILSDYTTT